MTNKITGNLRIGTSNVVVPGNKQTFPDSFKHKSRLSYYSSLFNTVELNSTFKKIPRLSTFEKWSHEVADDFKFTIKLWKEITHVKQLNINRDNIKTFLFAASHLGKRKGCLLIQFPASITSEYRKQVGMILQEISAVDTRKEWRIAVEFRSLTWYNTKTKKVLERYNASLVLHDMLKSANLEMNEMEDFKYFRFHGPTGNYGGCYSDVFLHQQAKKIVTSLVHKKDVYVYFNNTMGDAFKNARTLKAMVEKMMI
jgi:uncharacterized protein YecE (DUF72 family)